MTDLIPYSGLHVMVDLTLETGEVIEATDLHPFWIPATGRWVDAVDLKPGDIFQGALGDEVSVSAVATRTVEVPVYNATVDQLHTYFAGSSAVLVHNAQCDPDASRGLTRPQQEDLLKYLGYSRTRNRSTKGSQIWMNSKAKGQPARLSADRDQHGGSLFKSHSPKGVRNGSWDVDIRNGKLYGVKRIRG